MHLKELIRERQPETYDLHSRYVNPQFVRVLKVIGFDRNYVSASGATLVDSQGREVLDFLSGFGMYNIGRNHPAVDKAVREVMDLRTASLVQMDLGVLSGMLAEALVELAPPGLDAVFFTNSGTEGVEGALKLARQATRRSKVIYCKRAFHGLTLGSLSANGNEEFTSGNTPLLPDFTPVPFNDLEALEQALAPGDAAAFIVEPVQGKGVFIPDDDYLPRAEELCRKHGTLLIADEVQTGFGRTGKLFAVQHWDVNPDIMVVSKSLSGGYIPVGAILMRRSIHAKVFDNMERCFAHSNTFGQNDLAMAAGLATLEVIREEKLVERSERLGRHILNGLRALADRYEMLESIRGLGLMIGLQFGKPRSLALKAAWTMLHKMNEDLFCQMITMPLLEKHDILTQVAGHGLDTVKLLPPLVITEQEADRFLSATDQVLQAAHTFPGSAWETTKKLALRTARS